jgi:hypothetical protein
MSEVEMCPEQCMLPINYAATGDANCYFHAADALCGLTCGELQHGLEVANEIIFLDMHAICYHHKQVDATCRQLLSVFKGGRFDEDALCFCM